MEPTCFVSVTGSKHARTACGHVTARASRLQLSRQTQDALPFGPTAKRFSPMFIIGMEAATIFMSKAGSENAAKPKEWFEIPGATHHRLYDGEAAVGKAVAKLEEFFGRSL